MKKEKSYTFSDAMKGLGVMFETTKGFRGRLSVVLVLILGLGLLNAAFPLVLGRVIDSIVSGKAETQTLQMIALLVAITFGTSFVANYQGRLSQFVDESMRLTYLHRIYMRLLRLPISFHKTNRQGEVSEKVQRGVSAIPMFWSEYVFNLLPLLVYVAFALVFIFRAQREVGWILLAAGIVYSAISISTLQKFARLQREVNDSYSKARGIANDALFNVRMVKEAALEASEGERMRAAWFDESLSARTKLYNQQRNMALLQSIVGNTARALGLWVAYMGIRDGHLTIGVFSAMVSYASQFFGPLQQFFRQWRSIQNSLIALEDSDKILIEKEEAYQGLPLAPDRHDIAFKDVSFSYDNGGPVLEGLSFQVPEGKVVALVGESGVGKSSIIDLISAYYLPQSGAVEVGGVDTRRVDLKSLRSTIAVVSQEITLFNSTILDNIRYGKPEATDDEVKRAARLAKCDFIERLPEQWQQKVGERGLKLSVGQKQRIAIARAFLRDPKILILDEPTSALDAASERHIVQSLDEIMKGRTTIIIAHRLSTVRKADTILMFKDGKIVEAGTYDELVKRGGEFKKLHDLQALS
ncbi:MAG TPA: ABC transporter ATP-binding protein [Candidatus Paceibacterota bacterium]|nr:ABC transporter ATP-binding protein [Candidatus Paceibacterota bacterium]